MVNVFFLDRENFSCYHSRIQMGLPSFGGTLFFKSFHSIVYRRHFLKYIFTFQNHVLFTENRIHVFLFLMKIHLHLFSLPFDDDSFPSSYDSFHLLDFNILPNIFHLLYLLSCLLATRSIFLLLI